MCNLHPHTVTCSLATQATSIGNAISKSKLYRARLLGLLVFMLVVGFATTSFANRSVRISTDRELLIGQEHEVQLIYVNPDPDQSVIEYNLLISFSTELISLIEVIPTPLNAECGWEYFNISQPVDSMIRISARAESGSGNCLNADSIVLATIMFQVAEDSAAACQGGKLGFIWQNCWDNLFALEDSSAVLAVDSVNPYYNVWPPYEMQPGTTDSCVTNVGGVRAVNFFERHVGTECFYYWGPKGDLNHNELQYEIADYVMLRDYLVDGPVVFGDDWEYALTAGDINADGIPLRVKDLIWMQKVVIGDTLSLPRGVVATDTVRLIQDLSAQTISLDYEPGLAALHIKFVGEITPVPLYDTTEGNIIRYGFDGTFTRVLVKHPLFDWDLLEVPSGPLFSYTGTGNLVAYELTDWTTATLPSLLINSGGSCCIGTIGNVNCDLDDMADIGDLTSLIEYLFITYAPLCCTDESNIDGVGTVDIEDLTRFIDYLFLSQTPLSECN